MRILLLSPQQKSVYGNLRPPYPPLGLLQLGACLRASGHFVHFLDAALYPKRVEATLAWMKPDLVCITSVTPTFPDALSLARLSKRLTGAAVVMGGPHASALPAEPLGTSAVDFVVSGEGEETVVELAESLVGGSPSNVRGVYYRDGGNVAHTGEREPLENLDMLPFPDWSLVPNPGAYNPPEATRRAVRTVMTSRGCPHACFFCVSSKLFGRRVRRRSTRNVIREMEELVARGGAGEIHFADDCFTSDKRWVLDFCDSVAASGLKIPLSFMNGLRADEVDEEVLGSLKRAGVRTVGFGIETGSQQLLDESGKGLSLEAAREAFRISRKLGLNTWGFFIVGFPGETLAQAVSTFRFALAADPDFAKFFPLVPYPGSKAFERLKTAGKLDGTNWADYSLYGRPPSTLSELEPDEIARLIAKFYRGFYLRPGKLAREALRAISPSELWLCLRMFPFLMERFGSAMRPRKR